MKTEPHIKATTRIRSFPIFHYPPESNISVPNERRCEVCNTGASLERLAFCTRSRTMTEKMTSRFTVLLVVLLLIETGAAWAQTPLASLSEVSLQQDIAFFRGRDFFLLLKHWEQAYGDAAAPTLLRVASDSQVAVTDRYIALMGATKLGGPPLARELLPFLTDPSWMIRSAALQALCILNDPTTGAAALPLLQDPALAVRKEAVKTVAKLKPAGAAGALVRAIFAAENYHEGKALWVPQAALEGLVTLKAYETSNALRPLLSHFNDPELIQATTRTLQTLAAQH